MERVREGRSKRRVSGGEAIGKKGKGGVMGLVGIKGHT